MRYARCCGSFSTEAGFLLFNCFVVKILTKNREGEGATDFVISWFHDFAIEDHEISKAEVSTSASAPLLESVNSKIC